MTVSESVLQRSREVTYQGLALTLLELFHVDVPRREQGNYSECLVVFNARTERMASFERDKMIIHNTEQRTQGKSTYCEGESKDFKVMHTHERRVVC